MTRDTLTALLQRPGAWTSVYVDGTGADPQVEEEARRRAVRERLIESGAPDDDARAVEQALAQSKGLPSPSARVLLASGGDVVLDEGFVGPRLGPERLSHSALPSVLPLLRHQSAAARYIVVETSRASAEIRLERAGGGAEARFEIEGSTQDMTKVQAGGGLQSAFHRYAETTWKRNQDEVAGAVTDLIREEHPAFVVVSGDVRAKQLLRDALDETARDLLVMVDGNTLADGADTDELDSAIARACARHAVATVADVRTRASIDDGSAGAVGVAEVTAALQQARVDTLLLDNRMLDDERTLLALDAAPWVATDESERLAAGVIGRIPIAEALARAAVLTDARVVIEEDEPLADDEPRENRAVRDPEAALRWAESRGDDDGH